MPFLLRSPTYQLPPMDARLGSLYRRYLHGEDLDGKPHTVDIADVTQEVVTPHPSQPGHAKWCLWVTGLQQLCPKGFSLEWLVSKIW